MEMSVQEALTMAVITHSPARQLEGVQQLVHEMTRDGVTVLEALDGREAKPHLINGQQPSIYGKVGTTDRAAVGVVLYMDEITKECAKADLHSLTAWAIDPGADLYLGVIGEPTKGFSGMEQAMIIEKLGREGWLITQV
jgi:hypothetical protein